TQVWTAVASVMTNGRGINVLDWQQKSEAGQVPMGVLESIRGLRESVDVDPSAPLLVDGGTGSGQPLDTALLDYSVMGHSIYALWSFHTSDGDMVSGYVTNVS